MSPDAIVWVRWQAWIAALNERYGWGLNPHTQAAYLEAFSGFLKPDCSETVFACTCQYYHADHRLVADLLKPGCTADDHYVRAWFTSVLTILRANGIDWAHDTATDGTDLVQIACEAVLKSLGSFRYNSRFKTWAYKVVIQSVRHYLRTQRAKKRSAPTISLDLALESQNNIAVKYADLATNRVQSTIFANRVIAILRKEKDERLALLFALWTIYDQSPTDIAQRVGLSTSHVRLLLDQARKHLRTHPEIQEWL